MTMKGFSCIITAVVFLLLCSSVCLAETDLEFYEDLRSRVQETHDWLTSFISDASSDVGTGPEWDEANAQINALETQRGNLATVISTIDGVISTYESGGSLSNQENLDVGHGLKKSLNDIWNDINTVMTQFQKHDESDEEPGDRKKRQANPIKKWWRKMKKEAKKAKKALKKLRKAIEKVAKKVKEWFKGLFNSIPKPDAEGFEVCDKKKEFVKNMKTVQNAVDWIKKSAHKKIPDYCWPGASEKKYDAAEAEYLKCLQDFCDICEDEEGTEKEDGGGNTDEPGLLVSGPGSGNEGGNGEGNGTLKTKQDKICDWIKGFIDKFKKLNSALDDFVDDLMNALSKPDIYNPDETKREITFDEEKAIAALKHDAMCFGRAIGLFLEKLVDDLFG